MSARTVVLIHGMFMTPLCWEKWTPFCQERGLKVLVPAWPLHDRSVAEQRQRHPSAELAALSLGEVLAQLRGLVAGLPEPPILIGHSMGGLLVQLLLQEGLGAVGIAIDSAPPKGVLTTAWSFLRSNWPVINPLANLSVPVQMSLDDFAYAFAHTHSRAEQQALYERHVVPESRLLGKGPITSAGQIDFAKPRAPLLLIAGELDRIIPAKLNRSNFTRYQKQAARSGAVTAYKEFAGRTHWIIDETGWQEVASFALSWADAQLSKAS